MRPFLRPVLPLEKFDRRLGIEFRGMGLGALAGRGRVVDPLRESQRGIKLPHRCRGRPGAWRAPRRFF